MSLVHSVRINGHDPYGYLKDVLELPSAATHLTIAHAGALLRIGRRRRWFAPTVGAGETGRVACSYGSYIILAHLRLVAGDIAPVRRSWSRSGLVYNATDLPRLRTDQVGRVSLIASLAMSAAEDRS